MIPYGRQDITQEDIDAVVAVLRSDWLTQGPAVPQFEAAVSAMCRARHAVATNSATSALHVACLALDLGPGDWLWTSPITFVASANCGRYCGASVDFVDIDSRTYNMSPSALAVKLSQAKLSGRLPKVVVPVHFAGHSCDMEAIRALADEYRFRIVEDASHAVGASYQGEPVGSCQFSDVAVFSFHPVKIITSAEGGMAMTNDADLAARMARLRSHGITRDEALMTRNDGPWYYEQIDLGLNYRMTDVQAALGLSQLDRLSEFVERRRALAARYDRLLAELPVTLPKSGSLSESSWHLYVIQVDASCARRDRGEVFNALRAAGIGVNVHYIPVCRQPYYQRIGKHTGQFPIADDYYEKAITLPLYASLSDADQDRVVAALADALQ